MRRMKYFLGALLAVLLLFNLGGVGYADSPGEVLVDRSHGQAEVDISGFTAYLLSQGWTITDTTESITSEVLSGFGVFLMLRPSEDLTSAEVEAIRLFVEKGGGLWVLEDSASSIKSNSIASQFGVTFNADTVNDEVDYSSSRLWWPNIRKLEPHAITEGVGSFVYYGGCSLNVVSPASVIATGGANAYSDMYIYEIYPPVLAVAEAGSGRAVFIGDMSALRISKYDGLSDEHKQLLANIVEWLNQGGENEPQAVTVTIDIKPGGYPNSINLKSQGVTPVAVLTAGDFEANTIDPDTVVFAGALPVRSTMEDVDGDGDDDMLFHFKTQDLDLDGDSTEATLEGETREGTSIEGIDSVNIVPKGKKDK
jgi:hypothetical protein